MAPNHTAVHLTFNCLPNEALKFDQSMLQNTTSNRETVAQREKLLYCLSDLFDSPLPWKRLRKEICWFRKASSLLLRPVHHQSPLLGTESIIHLFARKTTDGWRTGQTNDDGGYFPLTIDWLVISVSKIFFWPVYFSLFYVPGALIQSSLWLTCAWEPAVNLSDAWRIWYKSRRNKTLLEARTCLGNQQSDRWSSRIQQ